MDTLEAWSHEIERAAPENITKILVATKCDMTGQLKISEDDLKQAVNKLGFTDYMMISTKTGMNVDETLYLAAWHSLVQKSELKSVKEIEEEEKKTEQEQRKSCIIM